MWEFDFKVSVGDDPRVVDGLCGGGGATGGEQLASVEGPTTVPEDLVAGEFRCVLTGR